MADKESLVGNEGGRPSEAPVEIFKRNELLDSASETYQMLAGETKPLADLFQILASDDNILGVGFGEIGDSNTIDFIIKRTQDKSIAKRSFEVASNAQRKLNEEIGKNDPSHFYSWFVYSDGDFEDTIRRLQHPELREEPKTDPQRSIRSINSAMGRDLVRYGFFVKIE